MSDYLIDRRAMANASMSCSSTFPIVAGQVAGTSSPENRVPTTMPASIPTDQAYYWSVPWQADVRESLEALRAGEFVEFDSDDPNDVARWLLSDDEE